MRGDGEKIIDVLKPAQEKELTVYTAFNQESVDGIALRDVKVNWVG